ncbi:MAG: SDR family NAD(P)-dependent oxidoreductase [Candidatus Hermodarchaeota archaeon]
MKDLKNKNCFLTGAASGIGHAFAVQLAKEGMNLFISDIDMQNLELVRKEIEEMGVKVIIGRCDVSKFEDFENIAKEFYSKLGDVDLLINNAGIAIGGPIEELELEDWKNVLDVNLWSIIHSIKAFLPRMLERKSGHIVNVASGAGIFGSAEPLPYIASKFAVVGISEALYGQLYNRGIRISVIVPSYIRTNIFLTSKHKFPKKLVKDYGIEKIEEIYKKYLKDIGSKAVLPKRAIRKYIAQIKENRLYVYDMNTVVPILALKGKPVEFEEFLVNFNENFINTRKEFFLKNGINLNDYI